ncbi:hypothetical protein B0H17DRAFT_1216235 [Mycena rosella]|uniref:Uncharacterized protein n=1 Tax=Mycena rosella TaxID=1033263 RepID=A0AAD7FU32_MYCRO|nr:hypothetical protein B0H17DRAFT_1216235 [Mycena rosella]
MSKTKTPLSGLHFERIPVNTYTTSNVKGKGTAPRSPSSASTTSTASSTNAFAALSVYGDSATVDEQLALELMGLDADSFEDSTGGDISSSDVVVSCWTTSSSSTVVLGAPSLTALAPPLAPPAAPNADSTLCDATDIQFFFDPDDDLPMPAAPRVAVLDTATAARTSNPPSPAADSTTTTAPGAGSPFLTPIPVPSGTAAVPSAAPSSTGSKLTDPPATTNIPRRRESASSAFLHGPSARLPRRAPEPPAPIPTTTAPTPTTIATASPAPTTAVPAMPQPLAQAAPTAAFTTVVTRGAARRAAAITAPDFSPSLPPGMLVPAAHHAAQHMPAPRPLPAPLVVTPAPSAAPAPIGTHLPAALPQAVQPQAAPLPAPDAGGLVPAVGAVGAAARIAPTAAAAALRGTPLPAFSHFPLDTPGIYSPDATTARDNVTPRLLNGWDALAGGKFFVFEWDGRPHSVNSTTIEDLKAAISHITGNPAPLVGPPDAANPASRSAPFMYLVRGVSDADAQLLLHCRVWNLIGGTTLFAIPYDSPSSPFLFTLDRFSFGPQDGTEVADIVVTAINEDHNAHTLLALNHDNYPAAVDPMAHFAASVRVTPVSLQNAGGRSRTAWNVTASPPSTTVANNRAWVSTVSSIKFYSIMHHFAQAISPPQFCSGCKSPGHIVARCPLPALPGWYSKPPSAPEASSSNTGGSWGERGAADEGTETAVADAPTSSS